MFIIQATGHRLPRTNALAGPEHQWQRRKNVYKIEFRCPKIILMSGTKKRFLGGRIFLSLLKVFRY